MTDAISHVKMTQNIMTYCPKNREMVEATIVVRKDGKSYHYAAERFSHSPEWFYGKSVHTDGKMIYYQKTTDLSKVSERTAQRCMLAQTIAEIRDRSEAAHIEFEL